MARCNRTVDEFTVDDINVGRTTFTVIDRITPDDIVRHLADREALRLVTGRVVVMDVQEEFIDFVVRDRWDAGV